MCFKIITDKALIGLLLVMMTLNYAVVNFFIQFVIIK